MRQAFVKSKMLGRPITTPATAVCGPVHLSTNRTTLLQTDLTGKAYTFRGGNYVSGMPPYTTYVNVDLPPFSLRKHAYSNILNILQPKKEKFSDEKFWIFFIFLLKTSIVGTR